MSLRTRETIKLKLKINGEDNCFAILPGDRLSTVLRREGYLSVKTGCYTGDCGTCTVLLDGQPIVSCLMLAAQAQGSSLTTVEALAQGSELHLLQKAFLDEGAVQCGFCTPGMLLSALALLRRVPHPSEEQVREAFSGNLCRCTGYERPVRAVLKAAAATEESSK
ncbi:MAG TPA: (2Fe-2S)-binding protein [Candidatus Fraserbacteria bacterium]|nr:(2Fe-2S)-binding protein [Candidatus Fraserbacteria bacterium]